MQCGLVRYRVNAKTQAALRPFEHTVIVRPTGFHSKREPTPTGETSIFRFPRS